MSEFNYKDFLKNSSFLNEAEEKEEDKVSEDRIEKAIKAVLKKEGGAAGVKPLVDAAKELGRKSVLFLIDGNGGLRFVALRLTEK